MGSSVANARERRAQKRAVLLERYKQESVLTFDTALHVVLTTGPAEQRAAAQQLKDVARRVRTDTVKALEQRYLSAPLHPPPARIIGGPAAPNLPQHPRRPAYASPRGMVADFEATLAAVLKQQPATFGKLVVQLGAPSATNLAALLQRPAMWGVLEKAGQRGQSSVLVGLLFQEIRKSTPEFAAALADAERTRHAFNEARRSRRLAGLAPSEAEAAAQKFATGEQFGPAIYYDNALDGNKKQLSDGTRVSWSADGHLLVLSFDEVKGGRRGRDRAPGQQDEVIRRVKKSGMIVGEQFVPPDRIQFPGLSGSPDVPPARLAGYFEGPAGGVVITPAGYSMTTVGVPAPGLREFAEALLKAWNKRVMPGK
jgi:hypothetical protein